MTDFIVAFMEGIVGLIIQVLPAPPQLDDVFNLVNENVYTAWDFVSQVNFIVPLDTILFIIGVDISIRLYMIGAFILKNVVGAIIKVASSFKLI